MKPAGRFPAWVLAYDRAKLARELGITWAAVASWVEGKTRPRPELANRIVELSNGALTLSDIYPPTSESTTNG